MRLIGDNSGLNIACDDITEDGIIYFLQPSRGLDPSYIGDNEGVVTNSGTICMVDSYVKILSSVSETGCVMIDVKSLFAFLGDDLYVDTGQSYRMTSPSSIIHFDTTRAVPMVTVAGLGNGNFIGFLGPILFTAYNKAQGHSEQTTRP